MNTEFKGYKIAISKENYPRGLSPGEVLRLIEWVHFIERRTKATVEDIDMVAPGRRDVCEIPLGLVNEMLELFSMIDCGLRASSDHYMELTCDDHYWILTRRPVDCLTKLDRECMAILNDNWWWTNF